MCMRMRTHIHINFTISHAALALSKTQTLEVQSRSLEKEFLKMIEDKRETETRETNSGKVRVGYCFVKFLDLVPCVLFPVRSKTA